MGYTNRSLVEAQLKRTMTDNEMALFTVADTAIKLWIDTKLGSAFDEVSASSRYYDGGVESLDIDPCTAITEVMAVNDDGSDSYEYTANDEYVAEPLNETVKRELRKRVGCFPSGKRRIKLTAKFSEYVDDIPEDIQIVATRIAVAMLNTLNFDSGGGVVGKESIEGHTLEFVSAQASIDKLAAKDPIVMMTINQRKEVLV